MKLNCLGSLSLISLLVTDVASADASAKNALGDDELATAFNSGFSVATKFTTDFGELTVTLENDPNEEDQGYIRPHLLSKAGSFIEMSHVLYMKKIELSLVEEQMKTNQLNLAANIDKSALLEDACPDVLAAKQRKSQIALSANLESQALLKDACPDALAAEPPMKIQKLFLDNSVFPIKYQAWDSEMVDKYAFPSSVLTITWSFDKNDNGHNYADLTKFNELSQFYAYLQSRLLEVVRSKAAALDKARFEEIRPYMYL